MLMWMKNIEDDASNRGASNPKIFNIKLYPRKKYNSKKQTRPKIWQDVRLRVRSVFRTSGL